MRLGILLGVAAASLLLFRARRRQRALAFTLAARAHLGLRPTLVAGHAPHSVPPLQPSLTVVYASIRKQCDEKAEGWPHAEAMRSKCSAVGATGRLRPPAFDDGHGPIGAYAMLRDPPAQTMLRWCRDAFFQLVGELKSTLAPAQRDEFDNLLWWNDAGSYHICVSVFHEHPSLLADEDKSKWRPVDGPLRARLIEQLRASTCALSAPQLTLDSLSITADGAFIAGFCDDEAGSFGTLKGTTAACGQAAMGGELTSRPKKLIHVTHRRLLGCPIAISADCG